MDDETWLRLTRLLGLDRLRCLLDRESTAPGGPSLPDDLTEADALLILVQDEAGGPHPLDRQVRDARADCLSEGLDGVVQKREAPFVRCRTVILRAPGELTTAVNLGAVDLPKAGSSPPGLRVNWLSVCARSPIAS